MSYLAERTDYMELPDDPDSTAELPAYVLTMGKCGECGNNRWAVNTVTISGRLDSIFLSCDKCGKIVS